MNNDEVIIEEVTSSDVREDYKLKVVIVGDSGVGKSNLIKRFTSNEFNANSKATVGVEFLSKSYKINDKIFKIEMWDTAGQERYKSITSAYYKGAKGAFVVYDITREKTFKDIDKWITELKENGNEDMIIILIGNKLDLENSREVIIDDVKRKAKELKVGFFETSALDGSNVEQAFDFIVEEIVKKKGLLQDSNTIQNYNNKAVNIDVGNKNSKNSKFLCC